MRPHRFVLVLVSMAVFGCTTDPAVQAGGARSMPADALPADTTPADAASPSPPLTAADLEWSECTDLEGAGPELECATLPVPLDHTDPGGATIDIALVRVPALDAGDRKGSILFNPGGPGASGVELIVNAGTYFQEIIGDDVAEQFDLVGFDPRGVGRSAPIDCVDDAWLDEHLYLDDTPDTAEEEQLLDEADTELTEACRDQYGDQLGLFSTEATARDMDLIRAAVGDEQLTYYGASYGTYLGAVYATLFPERVRALLLDAAFDPTGESSFDVALTQTVGFEQAFEDWAAWCDDEGPSCAFAPSDGSATAERWDALRATAEEEPFRSADGRDANEGVLVSATKAALYSRSSWPRLSLALVDAEAGDGAGLLALADEYNGRADDGTFDNSQQAFQVIVCASGISASPVDDPEQAAEELRTEAPRFGADATADSFDGSDSCTELTGAVEPAAIDYRGPGPVVIIGGLNDPATPFRWAEKMQAAMGPSSVLVSYDGDGHTAFGYSTCVADVATALFSEATAPEPGVTCSEDEPVPRPDWFDTLPTVEGVTPVDLQGNEAALGLTPTLIYAQALSTQLPTADAVAGYEEALTSAGFESLGAEPLPDTEGETSQAAFFGPDGELLVVLVLDADAVADLFGDQADFLGEFVPAGETLVLLTTPAG